jgi:hypothetical protein
VTGGEDLVTLLAGWLGQPEARILVGQVANRVVLENQGALTRSVEFIESCLRKAPSYSDRCASAGPGPLMAKP